MLKDVLVLHVLVWYLCLPRVRVKATFVEELVAPRKLPSFLATSLFERDEGIHSLVCKHRRQHNIEASLQTSIGHRWGGVLRPTGSVKKGGAVHPDSVLSREAGS